MISDKLGVACFGAALILLYTTSKYSFLQHTNVHIYKCKQFIQHHRKLMLNILLYVLGAILLLEEHFFAYFIVGNIFSVDVLDDVVVLIVDEFCKTEEEREGRERGRERGRDGGGREGGGSIGARERDSFALVICAYPFAWFMVSLDVCLMMRRKSPN